MRHFKTNVMYDQSLLEKCSFIRCTNNYTLLKKLYKNDIIMVVEISHEYELIDIRVIFKHSKAPYLPFYDEVHSNPQDDVLKTVLNNYNAEIDRLIKNKVLIEI